MIFVELFEAVVLTVVAGALLRVGPLATRFGKAPPLVEELLCLGALVLPFALAFGPAGADAGLLVALDRNRYDRRILSRPSLRTSESDLAVALQGAADNLAMRAKRGSVPVFVSTSPGDAGVLRANFIPSLHCAGVIVVTRELMEGAPAWGRDFVLAHELGHAWSRRMQVGNAISYLWSIPTWIMVRLDAPSAPVLAVLSGVSILVGLARLALSRADEYAADRRAVELVGLRAVSDGCYLLTRVEGPAGPRLLRGHPTAQERLRRLAAPA